MTIFLLGYMGCGKTTLGRALAARMPVSFIDLDEYIEARAGMSVREIFATHGEARFREMEREAVEAIASATDPSATTIVALGGGTPCQPGNMELINSLGLTVHLTTPIPRLAERLALAKAQRPLIAKLTDEEITGFITNHLASRLPYYRMARESFDSTLLENQEQVDATARLFIKKFMS